MTKLLTLPAVAVAVLLTAHPLPAQDQPEANPLFPDPALEAAVRAEVFEKRYNDEPLTKQDVSKISRVVGRGKGIKDLEGLQHCGAVMLLDFADNKIHDLTPIAGLQRLQSVTLANNKVKNIEPLKELTSMQLLDLSGNEVTELKSLTAMSNLRTLYVADNQLKTLEPIAKLDKIWSLDAAGNQIESLQPISGLKWLSTLNVQRNKITDLKPLKPLNELNFVLISGNQIKNLAPLVQMCREDAEGPKRFAPYMKLYLGNNPLSQDAKEAQIPALESLGVKVVQE